MPRIVDVLENRLPLRPRVRPRVRLGVRPGAWLVALLGLPLACTGTDTGTGTATGTGTGTATVTETGTGTGDTSEGMAVYSQPIDDGNSFTCATCHALTEPAADGLRRPGHALGDATRRPSWKNGQLSEMRAAVNSCLSEWMNAEPWAADDPRYLALYDFLDAQAPAGEAPGLSFEIVQPPADLSGGDPDAGQTLFNGSCAVCHGQDGAGTNQALAVGGLGLAPDYVAQRVRTSGRTDSTVYPGLTGGVMPFWAADRLTDDEVRDLVAYLDVFDNSTTSTTMTTTGDTDSDGTDSGTTGDPTTGTTTTGSGCDSTSDRIGWTAELSTKFHGVTGTAEIVDDCTVVITDFGYDGTGIDVRVYGGEGGDYDNGYAMTDDLLKAGGYSGVTLTATLPEGESMDKLDGISVWCVDVGVDFGSGLFAP